MGRSHGDRRAARLGRLAAWLWPWGRTRPVTRTMLRRADFSTSTQRMGLRFTEEIRNVFRFRWIRRRGGSEPQ